MLQVAREKLVHLGTCIGKLTHSGKFRLTVGALDILAQHAKYKVWDQSYLSCCRRQFCSLATSAPACVRPAP